MKTFLFLLLLGSLCFFPLHLLAQNCGDGALIHLYTQDDVDNFQANYVSCDTILASISIGEHTPYDEPKKPYITNLNGLSNIKHIGGSLSISHNPELATLIGLSNLESVGGGLTIMGNSLLIKVKGIEKLVSVKDLKIMHNSKLRNLNGLIQLTVVQNMIDISTNNKLAHINGLGNIESVGMIVKISDNPLLSRCCGVQKLMDNLDDYTSGPGQATMPDVGLAAIIHDNKAGCNSLDEVTSLDNCPDWVKGVNSNESELFEAIYFQDRQIPWQDLARVIKFRIKKWGEPVSDTITSSNLCFTRMPRAGTDMDLATLADCDPCQQGWRIPRPGVASAVESNFFRFSFEGEDKYLIRKNCAEDYDYNIYEHNGDPADRDGWLKISSINLIE